MSTIIYVPSSYGKRLIRDVATAFGRILGEDFSIIVCRNSGRLQRLYKSHLRDESVVIVTNVSPTHAKSVVYDFAFGLNLQCLGNLANSDRVKQLFSESNAINTPRVLNKAAVDLDTNLPNKVIYISELYAKYVLNFSGNILQRK